MRVSITSLSARRAWIEIRCPCRSRWLLASLSARRAWIEIFGGACGKLSALVALRKESVDRNLIIMIYDTSALMSLSARRAWIEM